MRHGGLVLAAGLLASTSAFPADMPSPVAAPALQPTPVVAAVYNWTGFYVGANAGYGFATATDTASSGALSASISENLAGPIAGGQFGTNFQTGNMVFGIETDADWSNIKHSETIPGASATDTITWFTTWRARFGLAVDNVLLYTTGGTGYGGATTQATSGRLTISVDDSRLLWTAGAGIEVGLTPNVSVRAEYLYLQTFAKQTNVSGTTVSTTVAANLARAGLNFRFTPANQVVTRY